MRDPHTFNWCDKTQLSLSLSLIERLFFLPFLDSSSSIKFKALSQDSLDFEICLIIALNSSSSAYLRSILDQHLTAITLLKSTLIFQIFLLTSNYRSFLLIISHLTLLIFLILVTIISHHANKWIMTDCILI